MPRPQKGNKKQRRVRPVPNSVKSYVDRAINRATETKRITYNSGLVSLNNSLSSSGDFLQLLINPSQGTTSYQRLGTKYKIKSMNIRGYLQLEGSSGSGLQKIGVRQMIVKSKKYPTSSPPASELGYLLESSGGSYQSFNGDINDLHAPVYNKAYTVARDRKHYMYQQGGSADDLSHAVKYFNIDLKQARGKVINCEFESGGTTNWGWWLLCSWVALDGTIVSTSNTNLKISYVVDMKYEDA